MKKYLFLLLLTTFPAFSGIYLEPSLGYLAGNTNENNVDRSFSGPYLNFRGGVSFYGFFSGLEGAYASTSRKAGAGFSKTSYDEKDFGLFLGYKFPFLLRAWGSLIFSSEFEDNNLNAYKGNGFKLGAGFTGLPLVSINLEYQSLRYDSLETSATSRIPLNGSAVLITDAIILSVSIPWDIPVKW